MNESGDAASILPMPNIGKRIRRVREAVPRRTQAEFAALLGVSRGAVGNWELGKGISRDNLILLSQKTKVKLEWLMSGPDDSPIPFVIAESIITQTAMDTTLTLEEAETILAWTFDGLGAATAAEARVLARAVLRAFRRQPVPPKESLSEEERRALVAEAIHLFRSE